MHISNNIPFNNSQNVSFIYFFFVRQLPPLSHTLSIGLPPCPVICYTHQPYLCNTHCVSCTAVLLALLDPDSDGTTVLQNVVTCSPSDTASHSSRLVSFLYSVYMLFLVNVC
jgi:hypothetical protein